MLGMLAAISASLFNEVSDIIGKTALEQKRASIYTIGFLTLVFGTVFLCISAVTRHVFVFSVSSLPTIIPRIILEITLSVITITALGKADRTTFGFVRTLTIPLLLIADLVIGYSLSGIQVIGVVLIFATILFVSFSGKMDKRGLGLLLLSSVLPVATLSLYKYDITHFNSVEAEQIIVSVFLMAFFYFMSGFKAKENPFSFLKRPVFLVQAITSGLAGAVASFAYLFSVPSIATAALRSGTVLFATLSGDFYFKEKYRVLKIVVALAIVAGLILLA